MRDHRQSPSFWPFKADWFWSVELVSSSKSIKRIQSDSFSHWSVIAFAIIKVRGDISLAFFCSPSFFSLTAASCLSRVRWSSRALAFRSFHYPLRKMGTTRSLANRVLLAVSSPMRNNISCRAELGRLPLLIPIYQKIMKYFVYDLNNNDNDSIFKQSFLMSKKSTFYKEFMILFQFHKHVWKIQSNQFRYRIFR